MLAAALSACAPDPPDTVAAARQQVVPIAVDAYAEARRHNDGDVYEFVADASGYVITPPELPAGEVMLTLTYVGVGPAPHSLVFEGINDDQPVVAVDFPGSNNGTVVLPPGGARFYDGAPGNRDKGFEGEVPVTGNATPVQLDATASALSWMTTGSTFTSAPSEIAPAGVPLRWELSVTDGLPHSVALEGVRDGQPLVAVDGPGTNRRTLDLPAGTYIYYCAVPGHREAGMEGLITFD